MKRIILATPGMSGADGVSELSRQWLEALDAIRGDATLEVWSLADHDRPSSLPGGVRFRTAQGNRFLFASYALRTRGVDADTQIAVMHLHLLPALLPLMLTGAPRGGSGRQDGRAGRHARVTALLLGIDAWKPLRRLERAALRRCWRITAISAHTVDRFREANPELADLPVTVCAPRVPASVPPQTVEESGAPFALIVGRMAAAERYKGHDALLDVWPGVLQSVPAARLVVAGGGDDLPRLQDRVANAGLSAHVTFTGPVGGGHLAALYRDCAFFVMPSTGEGFGLVYLEAMRAGKPCIAAPGAAAEIIEDGVQGLIVDQADGAALTAAIVRLFVEPALRDRLGASAAARVAVRYSAERFAGRVADLLEVPASVAGASAGR